MMSKNVLTQLNKIPLPNSLKRSIVRNEDRGKVVCIILVTTLLTIMPVGYHMVVLNVPAAVIQRSINESLYNTFGAALSSGSSALLWLVSVRSIIVSCQSIGALLGCVMVTPILNRCGVKSALMLFNNIILIAPKQIKGSLSCFLHIAVCFGSAIGAILSLDFMLGGESTWGYLLLAPGILSVLLIVAAFMIPETPNFYLQNGSYIQAIQSIDFYYGISYDDDDEAIREYWDMVPEMPSQICFSEAVMNPTILKGIFLGMIVSASQIFSGSMASVSYSTSMFSAVSFDESFIPFLPALGALVSIALTLPALRLVETTTRRSLLLSTLLLCLFADCLLLLFSLLSMDEWWASWLYLISFFIYGIGYNLGTGPVAYFIPAELVPAEAASVSLGAAVAVNWISSMVTTLLYYPLNESVQGWSYLIFIIPTSLFLIILFFFLPETRFHYRSDTIDSRLLADLGQPSPYGTFEDDEIDLF
ncbi:unnamed protein product [Cylicocyclus nassatus]|uniref:Major facilitator superfamily (MFS) profile domain-containing protein n=1 Tax=Cylicocyclus nassatus TaxID=53992 RepID=A0AA36H306_CYLNA|nr:unnamed protein product [Cylicocyclus nassatus]